MMSCLCYCIEIGLESCPTQKQVLVSKTVERVCNCHNGGSFHSLVTGVKTWLLCQHAKTVTSDSLWLVDLHLHTDMSRIEC